LSKFCAVLPSGSSVTGEQGGDGWVVSEHHSGGDVVMVEGRQSAPTHRPVVDLLNERADAKFGKHRSANFLVA
jgi:hypothetical protein